MSEHLINMSVHGIARVETIPDEGHGYVARRICLLDAEGNVVLEITAFAADHKTVPEVQEAAK